ncbi:MAG: short-chain dehydrogenase [Armatimonadetes bacterium Cent15-Ar3]|nr:MAG: short-chain dehydrogenase [Armatimonadetes bacterium Cent15-Ar3]
MSKAEISGKWALVTGASRGVGRQISLALADQGCNVILHSRDSAHTETLALEIKAKGVEVEQISAELANSDQVDAMISTLLGGSHAIDIVYNNAAIMTPYRSEWTVVPNDDLRLSFEVNVTALMRICHAFLPGMLERGWGRIINLTSGIADQPELIAYAVSKAAVDKFVKDTAPKLVGTGVMMNLLDPGWLRTDLGGPNAPGAVESVIPGALVPCLSDDGVSGILFRAQDYAETTN